MTLPRLEQPVLLYWMGGSPCAGKSTMADLIAARHGLRVFHVDAELEPRLANPDPATQPCLAQWNAMSWDERWMRPVDTLLEEVIRCYQEEFSLTFDALAALPAGAPVLVEGNNLLPDSLAPFLEGGHNAIWVVAAAAFQRQEYPRRGAWVQHVLRQCRAPEQALENWMARDVAFAAWVSARVDDLGYSLLTVDGAHSIAHNAACVTAHFGLTASTGEPTRHDRQP